MSTCNFLSAVCARYEILAPHRQEMGARIPGRRVPLRRPGTCAPLRNVCRSLLRDPQRKSLRSSDHRGAVCVGQACSARRPQVALTRHPRWPTRQRSGGGVGRCHRLAGRRGAGSARCLQLSCKLPSGDRQLPAGKEGRCAIPVTGRRRGRLPGGRAAGCRCLTGADRPMQRNNSLLDRSLNAVCRWLAGPTLSETLSACNECNEST
jgi:hypothetical protein